MRSSEESEAISVYVSENNLNQKFRRLVDEWQKDTEHMSSALRAAMHPSYLQIIGMGEKVIPLLLAELRDNPDHWFIALHSILPEDDPTKPGDNFDTATDAWLKWGRSHNHIK